MEFGSSEKGEDLRQRVAELSRMELARMGPEVGDGLDGCWVGGGSGDLGGRMLVEASLCKAGGCDQRSEVCIVGGGRDTEVADRVRRFVASGECDSGADSWEVFVVPVPI